MAKKQKTEDPRDGSGVVDENPQTQPDPKTPASEPARKPATACPITLEQFRASARALSLSTEGQMMPMMAGVKEFSSGSFGWYCGEKVNVRVGGETVRCQVSLSIVVVGSKPKS